MDGQRVKQWEARCIEEQPPACAAGCPLRVDVRAMLEKIKAGDFAAACAIFARVAPLPGACSAASAITPAKTSAAAPRRAGRSASARSNAPASRRPIRRSAARRSRSRKPKRVAVVGAGLAGLTAAFDLAMKGSAVIVFEAEARPLPRVASDYPQPLCRGRPSTPTSPR